MFALCFLGYRYVKQLQGDSLFIYACLRCVPILHPHLSTLFRRTQNSYGKRIFCDDDAIEKQKLGQLALAGTTSALFTTPIMAPGERVKCLLQTQVRILWFF